MGIYIKVIAMKEIPLTQGFVAIVDDEDYAKVGKFKWTANVHDHTVYAYRMTGKNMIYLHCFVMGQKGIDHRDGNGLNNQKLNLRPATQKQNTHNVAKHKDNRVGYKGVSRTKSGKKFRARIFLDGKQHVIGNFYSPEEAAQAYDMAAKTHFGEFARTNF